MIHFVIQTLLLSIDPAESFLLVDKLKKMKGMKCTEMEQWVKDATERKKNAKKLFYRIQSVKMKGIKKLLEDKQLLKNRNINLEWIDPIYDSTALIAIVSDKCKETTSINDRIIIIRMLLKAGANVNGKNKAGYTALFFKDGYRG
jgi:hypothetical protein